ncbi:MAG TPA: cytochrome c3 family protein [Thermodesulfobacteriota bacterium]
MIGRDLPVALATLLVAALLGLGAVAAAARDREAEWGRVGRGRPAPPADDVVVDFPARDAENPGRVAFSHVRHFGALGEKACTTCHSPEMGLLTSPAYASRAADPALEPHAPASLGRYCATCHNGTTRLSQVGVLAGRVDRPIFTAARGGSLASCQRCHAPSDHGADFTRRHEDVAERVGAQACAGCHRQDWGTRDRQAQTALLAAERALAANPEDAVAARVVGPDNFCVYCHRADGKWLERD